MRKQHVRNNSTSRVPSPPKQAADEEDKEARKKPTKHTILNSNSDSELVGRRTVNPNTKKLQSIP